jgi:tetratricopeptide (TPR) repeat protein
MTKNTITLHIAWCLLMSAVFAAGCAPHARTALSGSGSHVLDPAAESELSVIEKRLEELEPRLSGHDGMTGTDEKTILGFKTEIAAMDKQLSLMLVTNPSSRRIKLALAKVNFYGCNLDMEMSQKAERIYLELLDENPEDIEALYGLALFYTAQESFPLELYEELFRLDKEGKYSKLRANCAFGYTIFGNYKKAEEHMLIYIEAFPDDENAKMFLESIRKWSKGAPADGAE